MLGVLAESDIWHTAQGLRITGIHSLRTAYFSWQSLAVSVSGPCPGFVSGIVWPDGPQVDREFTEINWPRLEDSNTETQSQDAQPIVCDGRERSRPFFLWAISCRPEMSRHFFLWAISCRPRHTLSLSPATTSRSSRRKATWRVLREGEVHLFINFE